MEKNAQPRKRWPELWFYLRCFACLHQGRAVHVESAVHIFSKCICECHLQVSRPGREKVAVRPFAKSGITAEPSFSVYGQQRRHIPAASQRLVLRHRKVTKI